MQRVRLDASSGSTQSSDCSGDCQFPRTQYDQCHVCGGVDAVQVREEGPRPPPQPERVGLGKLGPLKFKNKPPARKAAAATAAAETAEGREQ